MSGNDVEVEGLRVAAGRRTILELERLDVTRGEVLTILGPNGAGKSTLLRACLGLRRISAGRIRIFGQEPGRWGGGVRLRRSIGYVPQEMAVHHQLPLTAREVVAIGRTGIVGLGRWLRREDWRLVDEWMERLGLAALRGQAFSDLSGGEQRKALLARAMVQRPRMLVLDEPTAHLDLGWREQIVRTLERLIAETAVTVLLVCHELEVIPSACTRVVLLEAGRLGASGPPAEVLTTERIRGLYGGGLRVWSGAGRFAVTPG